jgi:hypothetical protein
MRSAQFNLIELVLAVLFVGVWVGVSREFWDCFLGFTIVAGSAIQLFLTYLVTILVIRRYRKGGQD